MKKLFYFILPVSALSLVAFNNYITPIYVTGKLELDPHDTKGRIFEIIVKSDVAVVAKTNTQITGEFELSFTPANEKYFDFFYIDPKKKEDTIFLQSFTRFKSDVLQLTFNTSGKYHVDDDNHVVCPKCGEPDGVSKIAAYYYCSKDRIRF